MEVEKIDLAEWIRFGEGNNGQSYYHSTDDSIVLKLNDSSWTEEMTLAEFNLSRSVYELGVACPKLYKFVTDGERFGYTAERIKGKRSFSRMIADEPSRIPELAARFAAMARELHSLQCDSSVFQSALARRKAMIDNCAVLPDDVRARLEEISGIFDPAANTCLHGDFHPGNLISGEGGEYWIDLGGFSYGDPLIDISNLYLVAHYTPAGTLDRIFHVKRRTICRFMDEFLKCYYGEKLDGAMMEKVRSAALFRAGLAICSKPKSAFIFIPLIRGQKVRFALILFFVNLILPLLSGK